MASIVNEIVSVIVKLVITVAGTAFMTYGIPYLKQIGMYKIVQMAVRAAEKLGVTGAIQKADKKKYVIAALEKMHIKVTPTIEMMIEAAVKEMDIQNEKMPTIRQGSKDCTGGVSYAVTVLQRHLGLKVDGIFGAGTKAKLVEWQKAHGLAADGICGMATWSSF